MKIWLSKILSNFAKSSNDANLKKEIHPEQTKETNPKSVVSQKSYSADAPLTDPKEDKFGRYPFAQRIAQTISNRQDSNNLVIALYGKWGEGKTTILNYINVELKKEPDVIAIAFNPWRFPAETELLSSFYFMLADNLGRSLPTFKEKIGGLVEEYLLPIAAVINKEDLAKEVGNRLSKVDLKDLRDRIENILIEEGKQVVVLMDDIDRLEKAEIHAVFRLVKLSANLKNLIYVLAFDDEVVSDALQERYGTDNSEAGRNFLEKIVQVPINLPSIEPQEMRNFCFSAIDSVLTHCEIQLTNEDVQQFVVSFTRGLEIRLETPRMAVRYANILMFSLPLVKGEVNIVDFLLIEAIRVFYPRAYDLIRKNKEIFIGKDLVNFSNSQPEINSYRNTVDQAYIGLEQKEREALKGLLSSLFPRVQKIYGNTNYLSEWDKTWSMDKRIASDSYFSRYFLYSVPPGDVSDKDIDDLLVSLESISVQDLIDLLSSLINSENSGDMVQKLNLYAERIPPKESMKLAIVLSLFGDRFPNPQQLYSFDTPFARSAMLIARLIENLETEKERVELAKTLLETGKPISFSAEIIRWLRTDQSRYPNSISESDKEKLSKILAERISKQVSDEGLALFDEFPEHAPWLFMLISKYKSKDEANQLLMKYIDEDSANIYKVLLSYVPTAYPMMGSGLPHKSDLSRENYISIANSFDPSIIYSKLESIYGDELNSEEYPRFTDDTNKKIASQFMWLHKVMQNEKKKII